MAKVTQKLDRMSVFALDAPALRKEVSRLSAIANKRIQRLIERDWADSPALKALQRTGGEARFGVRGKTHQEVQTEAARLLNFLNAETSTITGVQDNIRQIAQITGIPYYSKEDIQSLKEQTTKFFELQNKLEQYLRSMGDSASALDYRNIWNQINLYVKEQKLDLSSASVSVESLLANADEILSKESGRKFEPMDGFDGFEMI